MKTKMEPAPSLKVAYNRKFVCGVLASFSEIEAFEIFSAILIS